MNVWMDSDLDLAFEALSILDCLLWCRVSVGLRNGWMNGCMNVWIDSDLVFVCRESPRSLFLLRCAHASFVVDIFADAFELDKDSPSEPRPNPVRAGKPRPNPVKTGEPVRNPETLSDLRKSV
jgi:hypothetical protein